MGRQESGDIYSKRPDKGFGLIGNGLNSSANSNWTCERLAELRPDGEENHKKLELWECRTDPGADKVGERRESIFKKDQHNCSQTQSQTWG